MDPERIELSHLACHASALPLSHGPVFVDATRIELVFSACDADVFPLSLRAQ